MRKRHVTVCECKMSILNDKKTFKTLTLTEAPLVLKKRLMSLIAVVKHGIMGWRVIGRSTPVGLI